MNNDNFDLAIGSKLNVYINYSLEGSIRITPLMHMKLGLGFNHCSNGRFVEPNKGLNLVTSFLGISYSLEDPIKNILSESKENEEQKKDQFLLMGSWGQKQISRRFNNKYSVEGLSAEYAHGISRTSWLGLALNTYYDPSIKKELALDTITASGSDLIRVSLNISYELKMGRVSYVIQPGFYLKNSYKVPGVISNRIAFRYQLNRHWLAGITIKAHWVAIADYIEWGLGYKI